MLGASEELNVERLQDNAMNIVELVCDAISQPVQCLIRPFYGTRYVPVPVTFLAMAEMTLLPAFSATVQSVGHMIPFVNIPAPVGMFGLGSFAELYLGISAVHGVRLWRRMIDMSREAHSQYEGPALFFFAFLPKGTNFYFTRIVWEPLFVLVSSVVFQDLLIIQSPLALYLKCAALALMMKNFIGWFRAWEYMRQILDARISAPIIARLAEGKASEAELEPLHLASIPQNIDPEIRKATIAHIARSYSQE
jgi:hypothetical protein